MDGRLQPRAPEPPAHPVGAVQQWALLTRRAAEVMTRNRLTLAVLLGSPALVIAMMAVLFQPGAFEHRTRRSVGPAQTVFWIAFAGFFFGLTFGLLQIVGELAVFRRERFAGAGLGAYVLSKVAVLAAVAGAGRRRRCSASCGCSTDCPPPAGTPTRACS